LHYLYIAAGGAIGASARYLVAQALAARGESLVPWYTLIANISGAFLLGIVVTLSLERGVLSEPWLLFLGVGVLGGYTTFSTFSYETLDLFREGLYAQAAAYSLGSLAMGVVAAALGVAVARVVTAA
jgi:CrcB protein